MQVGLARGRARSVVGGTRCSWSRSAGPSLLGRYPGASEWTAEQVAEHWGCISDSRCRHGGHCRGCFDTAGLRRGADQREGAAMVTAGKQKGHIEDAVDARDERGIHDSRGRIPRGTYNGAEKPRPG